MILGFSTRFKKGSFTYFPERIVKAADLEGNSITQIDTSRNFILSDDLIKGVLIYYKVHTIRKGYRWKPGDTIHFATGVRTKNYHCFAKGECKGVQGICINFNAANEIQIVVDGVYLSDPEISILASNDGLKRHQFQDWFYDATNKGKEIFNGQIIHWTDLKY